MQKIDVTLVLIKGAGDLASGVAARLHRCGFPVVMTELPQPLMVRRTVSFGEAVYQGEVQVEDIVARRVSATDEVHAALAEGVIPVLVDPEAASQRTLSPTIIVDAIMAKRNTGTTIADAPLVITLGPGFTARVDCHTVIETNRGHWLGRVLWKGTAQADTGSPGRIANREAERVLHAPVSGVLTEEAAIGDLVKAGQRVASVDGQPVFARIDGVLRGLIRTGLQVPGGLKIGDVDPRGNRDYCFNISDKSLSIAGGVLEAILFSRMTQTGKR